MTEPWEKELTAFLRPRTALVGIGNRLRGDDAFGPLVVDKLAGRSPWPVWDAGEAPEGDIGRIASLKPERVLLLDAVRWGASPGAIGFFALQTIPWQGVSTHAISLRLFAELLSYRTGCTVALLGPEPRYTGMGLPLCAEVRGSVECVVDLLVREAKARTEAEAG